MSQLNQLNGYQTRGKYKNLLPNQAISLNSLNFLFKVCRLRKSMIERAPRASQGREERSTSEQKQPLQDQSPAQALRPCSCIPGTHSLDHCRQQSLRLPVCPTNHDKKVSTYFTTEHYTVLSAKCIPCIGWWLKTSGCSIWSNHSLWNCTHARTVPSPIVVERSVVNSFARTLPTKGVLQCRKIII